MHRYEAAHDTFELRLEFFLTGIDDDLSPFTEDELFHFQKPPQIALIDLPGVHFVNLALVEKDDFVDRIAFVHGNQ